MLDIIITTAFGFFGAAVGTALYIAGKKSGKVESDKEHLQSMRDSLFKGSPLFDFLPLIIAGGLLNSLPPTYNNAGFTAPQPKPQTSPTEQN